MRLFVSLLAALTLFGCNGKDGADNIVVPVEPEVTSPVKSEDTSAADPLLGKYDGVYESEDGHSLFFSEDEQYVYLYRPIFDDVDKQFTGSNRAIEINNEIFEGKIIGTTFTKAQTGDYYIYQNANVALDFTDKNVSVDISDFDGIYFYDKSSFVKNKDNLKFDLIFSSYSSLSGDTMTFTEENKVFATYDDCQIEADVTKGDFYYNVKSAFIKCDDDQRLDDLIGGSYRGIIYKANNKAVLILRNSNWIYRDSFELL